MSALDAFQPDAAPLAPLAPTLQSREPTALMQALFAQRGVVRLLIGQATAVPDAAHVRVVIGDATLDVPRLASYAAPASGDVVYLLAADTVVLALGKVTRVTPLELLDAPALPELLTTDPTPGALPFADEFSSPPWTAGQTLDNASWANMTLTGLAANVVVTGGQVVAPDESVYPEGALWRAGPATQVEVGTKCPQAAKVGPGVGVLCAVRCAQSDGSMPVRNGSFNADGLRFNRTIAAGGVQFVSVAGNLNTSTVRWSSGRVATPTEDWRVIALADKYLVYSRPNAASAWVLETTVSTITVPSGWAGYLGSGNYVMDDFYYSPPVLPSPCAEVMAERRARAAALVQRMIEGGD